MVAVASRSSLALDIGEKGSFHTLWDDRLRWVSHCKHIVITIFLVFRLPWESLA